VTRYIPALPDGVVMPVLPGALCAGRDPELWQTDEPSDYVRGVCAACPALVACRQWSIEHDEIGVWAGMTRYERARAGRAS